MKKGIILIGMAGVGKSTVGRVLASNIGYEFMDMDDHIININNVKVLQDVVDKMSEDEFVKYEGKIIKEFDLTKKVSAPGGSIVYCTDDLMEIKDKVIFIHIKDIPEKIFARIPNIIERGIIGLEGRTFEELCKIRFKLCELVADYTINVNGKTPEELVGEIVLKLKAELK